MGVYLAIHTTFAVTITFIKYRLSSIKGDLPIVYRTIYVDEIIESYTLKCQLV